MYVGISPPSGPGPSEDIEAPEERIKIQAVKHRRNEMARYLCSNNIQMVKHFWDNVWESSQAFGYLSTSVLILWIYKVQRFYLVQAYGYQFIITRVTEQDGYQYRIFLCFMDSGLARCDQTSSPHKLASSVAALSLVSRIFLYISRLDGKNRRTPTCVDTGTNYRVSIILEHPGRR